jgi:hypothetical protein
VWCLCLFDIETARKANMNESTVFAVDKMTDQLGSWEQWWMCPPPDEDSSFRVLDERWDADLMVRRIYAWQH